MPLILVARACLDPHHRLQALAEAD